MWHVTDSGISRTPRTAVVHAFPFWLFLRRIITGIGRWWKGSGRALEQSVLALLYQARFIQLACSPFHSGHQHLSALLIVTCQFVILLAYAYACHADSALCKRLGYVRAGIALEDQVLFIWCALLVPPPPA